MGTSSKSGIHVIWEEESYEESNEDLGIETKVLVTIKNPSRKIRHKKREEASDKENELGLRKTMDNTFKKDPKGNKGPSGVVPPKGGPSKSLGK